MNEKMEQIKEMSKMQEYFQGLVQAGIIPQEPMNYDASSMKIYITYLENRIAELEDKIESGRLVELPCKVGDTVYGVGFTDCQESHTTDEKEKRKIFNTCSTMNGRCDKCKYSIPAIHKFVCTQIQLCTDDYTLVVGAKCENYRFENVFTTQESAEARLKELQEGKK